MNYQKEAINIKFLDLFSGVGGFRTAFEKAGHKCIGYVEIDKFARKSYKNIFNTKGEWTRNDITKVKDEEWRELRGKVDIITAGFPCQAFSIAGKRRGFQDTRGTMFFEIARATKQIQPRILLLENVKGLLSHNKGNTFATIITTLDELGFDAEWQVLNSKDFGVPQSRERVFIVGYLRGTCRREIFPIRRIASETSISIAGYLDIKGQEAIKRVYKPGGISPALTTMQGGRREPKILAKSILTPGRVNKRQNGRRMKKVDEPMFTITAQDRHGVLLRGATSTKGYKIRKLTPLECWRLQGFDDEAFYRAKEVNSDSQLYKQAGNSVTVNVVYEIAKRLV